MARARNIILMLRDVSRATGFYGEHGLGLILRHSSDALAEFETGGTPLILKAASPGNEAVCSVGYSPLLCFDVADMESTVQRCLQMGAHLDGPIKYPAYGKVASLRSPDGHMIGLFEPAHFD
ncbi:unnamed protein product [Phaeothamnion confervicola]